MQDDWQKETSTNWVHVVVETLLSHTFEGFVPCWWSCVARIRRFVTGVDVDISKNPTPFLVISPGLYLGLVKLQLLLQH